MSCTTFSQLPQSSSKVKVTSITQTWSEVVTLRISCPSHIFYKGRPNLLQLYMILTHSMMVCHAHHLATDSNLAKNLLFTECGHVAYQIKGNEMYVNIQANILTLHTPSTPGVGSKGQVTKDQWWFEQYIPNFLTPRIQFGASGVIMLYQCNSWI